MRIIVVHGTIVRRREGIVVVVDGSVCDGAHEGDPLLKLVGRGESETRRRGRTVSTRTGMCKESNASCRCTNACESESAHTWMIIASRFQRDCCLERDRQASHSAKKADGVACCDLKKASSRVSTRAWYSACSAVHSSGYSLPV